MKHTKHWALILSSLTALTACSVIPPQAYYNRGDPENLIDVSSEVVNMDLSGPASVNQIAALVNQDKPARAVISCSSEGSVCRQVRHVFEVKGVPTEWKSGPNGVSLIYERVVARDCENRYIDNSVNPYNLNHPTYGCSLTGNMVQMVSDKHQFTNPSLLDFQDGVKAVQVYEGYAAQKPADASAGSTGSATQGAVQSIIK